MHPHSHLLANPRAQLLLLLPPLLLLLLLLPLLQLLEEALNEDAYLADVAGLHYGTSPEGMAGRREERQLLRSA